METTFILLALALLGLCFGSFVNALVWRLRKRRNFVSERSECTHCHHVLAWYDLIPVLSWIQLRGKCRYCHKPIDDSPIVELMTAVLFIVSYVAWPFGFVGAGLILFGLWLGALVLLMALTVYDIRWQLLPDRLVWPLVVLGGVFGLIRFYGYHGHDISTVLLQMGGGVLVISGLYFVLHQVSRGAWVGFGDVKLNIFIGLILGWQQALLAIFLANLIGMIVVLPGIVLKKMSGKSRIPFGPFLILACIIALLWGQSIIDWYLHSLLSL